MSKFKIGDRVRVYGTDNACDPAYIDTTVTEVFESGILYLDEATSLVKGTLDFTLAHEKQCRKLRPRKSHLQRFRETARPGTVFEPTHLINAVIADVEEAIRKLKKAGRKAA